MIALSLASVVAIAAMLNLAQWQYHRHQDRQEFNTTLTARFNQQPRALTEFLAADVPLRDLEWLPTSVTGTYLPGESLSMVNVAQFGQAGFNSVTPLQLADGRIVIVNRGFLPLGQSTSVPVPPSGEVTVVGRIRLTAERRTGAVTDPTEGRLREIQRIDIDRLARQIGGDVVPVYLEVLQSSPTDDPALSAIAEPDFTLGPHLSYVVQWTVFSIFVVVGWLFVVARERRKDSAAAHE
jgi:cytochrome oxidase assembly protein ShyY1